MKAILSSIILTLSMAFAHAGNPIIGISCSWNNGSISVPEAYIKAVVQAGGVPLILPITQDTTTLHNMVEAIDAIVLIGGEDFSPLLFGEEPIEGLEKVVPERDEYDLTLIRIATKAGKPILGICRGLQGINIAFGGSLYQDIPSQYDNSLQHRQTKHKQHGSHTIMITPGSMLKQILQTDKVVVNSVHHQAIKDMAQGFTATAYAKDGIIEAIENQQLKIIAVQFHPEEMASTGDTVMQKLFNNFIKQASESKQQ